jgi:hypothetical protein
MRHQHIPVLKKKKKQEKIVDHNEVFKGKAILVDIEYINTYFIKTKNETNIQNNIRVRQQQVLIIWLNGLPTL